jgi:hypothetical protein
MLTIISTILCSCSYFVLELAPSPGQMLGSASGNAFHSALPPRMSETNRRNRIYALLDPLGGYVKMLGENPMKSKTTARIQTRLFPTNDLVSFSSYVLADRL